MRKKIALVILLALTITACSKPKEPEEPKVPKEPDVVETTDIEKLDKDKPYVYSELYNEEIDVVSLIKDVDPNSEILGLLNSSLIPTLVSEGYADSKDSVGINEKIYVNIKSEDAVAVQNKLDEALEVANTRMTDRYNEIKETQGLTDIGGFFTNQVLLNVVETDRFISFTVSNRDIRIFGDGGSSRIESYVLSKTDGRLLSPEEMLNESGYTLDEVEDFVREECRNYEGEAFYEPDMIRESESFVVSDVRNSIYLNYDNPFILTKDTLIIPTSIYIPLGMGVESHLSYIEKPYKERLVQNGDVKKVHQDMDYVSSEIVNTIISGEEVEIDRVFVNLDSEDAKFVNMKLDHQMREQFGQVRTLAETSETDGIITFLVKDVNESYYSDTFDRMIINQTFMFDGNTGILVNYEYEKVFE